MRVDLLVEHAGQLVTCAGDGPKWGAALADPGIIEDGAVAICDGLILAVGPTAELRARYQPRERLHAAGRAVLPGLVDCHTHAVWAGRRTDEFERRLGGESYFDILAGGGGILSTVAAVRAASLEELAAQSRPRLRQMLRLGTTTAEVKTGYGLSLVDELKLLQAIAHLAATQSLELVPTFLGAHALPAEYRHDPDGYLALVTEVMLPAAVDWYRGSAFALRQVPLCNDVFCDRGAFDVDQSRRVLAAGRALGLPAKVHADEFASIGGVGLALEQQALSVDHLDVTVAADRVVLGKATTVGVILPAVNFHLVSSHYADGRALIDAGCSLALATDFNPGSAPCPSLPLAMALACRYGGLTPVEALYGVTLNAAWALGLGERIGSLETGKQADLILLDGPDFRQLAEGFGGNPVAAVIKQGRRV